MLPKNLVDFLQEILVPETALRLISQDKGNITLEEARKIMEDSGDFGDYVHREQFLNKINIKEKFRALITINKLSLHFVIELINVK